jgi:hypothetical protein
VNTQDNSGELPELLLFNNATIAFLILSCITPPSVCNSPHKEPARRRVWQFIRNFHPDSDPLPEELALNIIGESEF